MSSFNDFGFRELRMAAELLVKAHGIECGSNRAIWLEMAFRQTRRAEMVAEEIEPSFETPDEGLA